MWSQLKSSLPYFVLVLIAALIALTLEIFLKRRDALVRNISAMVGEHLLNTRASANVGGPMPLSMLSAAMNQNIHPDNDSEAKKALDTLTGIVTEAKRRSFMLPLMHKDVALNVKKWAETPNSSSSIPAATLLSHIYERHAQHIDQLISQSFVKISADDENTAVVAMRSLTHQIDGALAAGLKVQPSMALLKDNKEIAEKWSTSSSLKAQEAAKLLLKTVEEARVTFHD